MKRALALILLLAAGASFARQQSELDNGLLRVRVNPASRTWTLDQRVAGDWAPVITDATLSLSLAGGDSISFMTDGREVAFNSANVSSADGRGRKLTVTSSGERIDWAITFTLYKPGVAADHQTGVREASGRELWISARLRNSSPARLEAGVFHLIDAQGEGGAHFASENLYALSFFGTPGVARLDSGVTVSSDPGIQLLDKSSNGSFLAGFVTNGNPVHPISVTSAGVGRLGILSSSPIYSSLAEGNGAQVPPLGGGIVSDTLVVSPDDGPPFEAAKHFASLLAAHAPVIRKPFTPGANMTDLPAIASATSLWRSWPAYRSDISEDTIIANLNAAASLLKSAGLRVIEVDQGYEKDAGEWETNAKFPHGHKWLVDRIHAKGFLAGLWIAPFAAAPGSSVSTRHPEWLLRDEADSLIRMRYEGGWCNVLDPERSVQWTEALMKQVAGWGYDVVHLARCGEAAAGRKKMFVPPGTALKLGLRALRRGAGSGVFLIGSDLPAGSAAGILDAVDSGPDTSSLSTIAAAAAASIPFDNAAWYGISGPLTIGAPRSPAEARAAANLAVLSGRTVVLGDRLTALSDEQFALLAKTLPVAGGTALPVDLYDNTTPPAVWSLNVEKPYGNWHIVGLFNWTNDISTVVMDAVPLGLSPGKEYSLFDYWEDTCLGTFRTTRTFRLQAGESKLFSLHELPRHPAIVSTTRHIAQGAVDLVKESWEGGLLQVDAQHLLRGPWTMTLYLPPGMKIKRITAPWKHTESVSGRFVRVTFPATQGEKMLMSIAFE